MTTRPSYGHMILFAIFIVMVAGSVVYQLVGCTFGVDGPNFRPTME